MARREVGVANNGLMPGAVLLGEVARAPIHREGIDEQDGTWHQTVIRDTDFTPSHILEFYLSYPIYIIAGWGAFMYARTRIPMFANRISVAFLLFFAGPFMIFPNVGLNEWGHTFWFMEELFTAPLHWGFVFFGWFALAVFGVVLQVLGRVIELSKEFESDVLAL
jgi:methane/ammonia monooxygenase subunit C